VSFGERLSTRLFAAYLSAQGVPAKQYDAYAMGVTTSDNFVNAEVSQPASQPASAGCSQWRRGCC
jgi:aspartate kinase